MTIYEIKDYLSQDLENIDSSILDSIELYRKDAINRKDEETANYMWCLRQVYRVKKEFTSAYKDLLDHRYENAWRAFDMADMELSFLEEQTEVDVSKFPAKYGLDFIKLMIPRYQKLFPYQYFFSRESIIKLEECSICGKRISLRHGCGHRVGHLYMGEQCCRKVTDMELVGMSIVKDPFDKYSVLEIPGKENNYEMLDLLVKNLHSPYDPWYLEEIPIIKEEYRNIGRNDPCPCGSGKKYKKCCMGSKKIYTTHFRINLLNQAARDIVPLRFVNSWK